MKTTLISVLNLCAPCYCHCRYCLLSWDGKCLGIDYDRSIAYARRLHDWLKNTHHDIRFMYSFGYSMEHPNLPEAISFMQETGAEYIGRMAQWIYFRKKAADGEFDIFSDVDSKIGHLDKIGKMLGGIGCINLALGLINSFHPAHVGWINLLAATLLMYALGRIQGKKEALEEKRLLME